MMQQTLRVVCACSVRMMPDGSASTSTSLQGLQQCVAEFDRRKAANAVPDMKLVISMSFGSSADASKAVWDAAINQLMAQRSDILLVAAAGNEGINGELSYPAGHPQVLGVAAVDANGDVASFSTRQKSVSIAGPGARLHCSSSNSSSSSSSNSR
jgi:subtilisin family serine protease